jgi:signal transduction histidine kinase
MQMDLNSGTPTAGRVLIVDDATDISSVLAMKLEREGLMVTVAGSTERAGKLLEVDDFDVILLDIRLPDGSGFELLSRLRQRRSLIDTPIIMMSGLDQTSDVVAALQDGANDYLTKPFDLAVVLARIRTQLAIKRLKEANDRFLHVAGNDLKKPLRSLIDSTRQLRDDFPVGTNMTEDGHRALAQLTETAEYMRNIITDVLELRALRERYMQLARLPADIGAVVRQAVARYLPYADRKGVELRMEFDRDLPNIKADDARILQVLENFIDNAVKFSPIGSATTVRTRVDGDWIVCEVLDRGTGIPKKEAALLFKEYAQLGNQPMGGERTRGLGLAICREIVVLHGGEIGAYNNPDGGSTFWFRLPIG